MRREAEQRLEREREYGPSGRFANGSQPSSGLDLKSPSLDSPSSPTSASVSPSEKPRGSPEDSTHDLEDLRERDGREGRAGHFKESVYMQESPEEKNDISPNEKKPNIILHEVDSGDEVDEGREGSEGSEQDDSEEQEEKDSSESDDDDAEIKCSVGATLGSGLGSSLGPLYDHSPGEVYTIPEEEEEAGSPTSGDGVTSLRQRRLVGGERSVGADGLRGGFGFFFFFLLYFNLKWISIFSKSTSRPAQLLPPI